MSSQPGSGVDATATGSRHQKPGRFRKFATALARHSHLLRQAASALLVAVVAVVVAISALTPHLRVCDDIVARVGSKPTFTSCQPLEITAAPVILILILALGFILPDVRRISIAGVVELEREVREQQQRVEQLASRIDLIVSSKSSSNVSFSFEQTLPSGVSVNVDEGQLAQKEQLLAEEIGELRDRE